MLSLGPASYAMTLDTLLLRNFWILTVLTPHYVDDGFACLIEKFNIVEVREAISNTLNNESQGTSVNSKSISYSSSLQMGRLFSPT